MIKRTFRYCATHKEDEAYMEQMCARGWAALSLTEGFWTFESCPPHAYCYRICYLRGKSRDEIDEIKKQYASKGITFVSRYSFWAIFRSSQPFQLYTPEEDREICRKIYAPMPIGAAFSWLLFAVCLFLSLRFSLYFLIPSVLIGFYGSMCTWLALSYHKLLKK